MNNSSHDEILLARWLANELTEEELVQLRQREDYADLSAIVEGMKLLEPPPFSEEESWQKLKAKRKILGVEKEVDKGSGEKAETTNEKKSILAKESAISEISAPPPEPVNSLKPVVETPIRTMGRRQWAYAAAAAVAILLVTWFWLSDNGPSYEIMIATSIGEQKKVILPDGSTVQLNAKSMIGYNDENWADERNVYLAGEGFFRAKKGQVFTVLAEQGKVAVAGTQFNVFAREKELDVKCTEGRVQVFNLTESEKVLVRAGEQVSVINGRMQKRKGIDFTPKWYKGESVFQSAPRNKVFKEIERQFGVVIVAEGLEEELFSGKFVHNDLEKALRMVSVPMNLKYEIEADTVRFWDK